MWRSNTGRARKVKAELSLCLTLSWTNCPVLIKILLVSIGRIPNLQYLIIFDIWSNSSPPAHAPRWYLIIWAHLQQEFCYIYVPRILPYPWCLLLVIFHPLISSTCSVAANTHLSLLCLELNPCSTMRSPFLYWNSSWKKKKICFYHFNYYLDLVFFNSLKYLLEEGGTIHC